MQRQFLSVQDSALQPVIALQALVATDDPTTMKPADATAAITQARSVNANLYTLKGLAVDLDKAYAEALRQ